MGFVEKIRGFRQGKQPVTLGLKKREEGPSYVTSQKTLPLDESGYLTGWSAFQHFHFIICMTEESFLPKKVEEEWENLSGVAELLFTTES